MTAIIHQLKEIITRPKKEPLTPCGVSRSVYPKGWKFMSQNQRNRMVFHNLRKQWSGRFVGDTFPE